MSGLKDRCKAVELGFRNEALREQGLIAVVVVPGFSQLRPGSGQAGARRLQGVFLVVGIEGGDNLARLDGSADIHVPLDHPAIDTEGEIDFGLRLNVAGKRDRLAAGSFLHSHDADGADLRSGRLCGGPACREQGDRGKREQ